MCVCPVPTPTVAAEGIVQPGIEVGAECLENRQASIISGEQYHHLNNCALHSLEIFYGGKYFVMMLDLKSSNRICNIFSLVH